MIKHYFLIAFRNLRRKKVYSAINILGLALIMAWLAVSYQSMKVATANPVDALREE